MSDLRFLSFVRRGIGGARPGGAVLPVTMSAGGQTVQADVNLFGPGDVAGVDRRMILRREPAPNSTAFPPNHLAYVELARADFPWLMSPAAPDAHQRVSPWLCLIVVEASAEPPRNGTPLPVVDVVVAELPSLDEIAVWAHVQISGPFAATDRADVLLRNSPERGVARIVAPRRLEPQHRYRACLVPATKAGRLAGLGEDPQAGDDEQPAWDPLAQLVTLPVYDFWEFETGEPGDFETLARKLVPCDLRGVMAPWPMRIDAVSGSATPREVTLPSPLAGDEPPTWTGPSRQAAATRLQQWLDEASSDSDPTLGPPLYGASQALPPDPGDANRTPSLPADPGWMRDLNLDPRYRAIANVGAEIVRAHQDEWVALAWQQLGDIRLANRLLSGAAFASAIGQRAQDKHLAPLDPGSVLAATRPALSRLREGMVPISRRIDASRIGVGVLGGAYRRVSRVRARMATVGSVVDRLNRTAVPLPTPPVIRGALTVTIIAERLRTAPRALVARADERVRLIRGDLAVAPHRVVATEAVDAPAMLPLAELAQAALAAFAPSRAASRRVSDRFTSGAHLEQVGALQPVAAAPEIAVSLADQLVAIDPRLMAPGVGALPPNGVGYLRVDAACIEALVVGANHELARELSWRGVPVDLRATLLRRFWPITSQPDTTAIASWSADAPLGEAGLLPAARPGTIVVVRGEIVRRFPDALYYLTRAVADGPSRKPSDTPQDFVAPLFRGRLTSDTLYLGFAAEPAALRGNMPNDRGFYFVIQEHPGAARFGFDETQSGTFMTWMDLAWSHVAVDGVHVALAPAPPVPSISGNLVWGADSAHMAAIARRRTARLSIHCFDLLP